MYNILRNIVWLYRRLVGITSDDLSNRYHKKRSSQLINEYLSVHDKKLLQIGCQSHPMEGWLNVDLEPKSDSVVYMDATKTFPFADSTFNFIFSEHMIEHVTFNEGGFMLSECYRTLKPGGRIRIVTPDLKFLIELYSTSKSELQNRYISFSKRYFKSEVPSIDTVVINNFFRDWGHKFIHDEKSLRHILAGIGFTHIDRLEINESKSPELRNIEKHGIEITEEFNRLESIVIEAVKP